MELLLEGLKKAIEMILSSDPEILEITLLTLRVSISAVLVSTLIGIPTGMFLGLAR